METVAGDRQGREAREDEDKHARGEAENGKLQSNHALALLEGGEAEGLER